MMVQQNSSLLFIPGAACTPDIWKLLSLTGINIEWPHSDPSSLTSMDHIASWLEEYIKKETLNPDVIIAHSLGGLLAYRLVSTGILKPKKLILVESFLQPPSPFFQNLLCNQHQAKLGNSVNEMLKTNKPYWSELFLDQLRHGIFNFSMNFPTHTELHAIYGDRGKGTRETVIINLKLPEALSKRMMIHIITDACHFPMLEEPEQLDRLLNKIISQG